MQMNFPTSPSNIDELREDVSPNKKLPFKLRIFKILKYSLSHPDEKAILGLFWDDQKNFLCNSKISGDFLGLKDNSMNTNLRESGFVIDDSFSSSDLMQKYGSLSNANRWKRRYHFTGNFTQSSTEQEVMDLPRQNKASLDIKNGPIIFQAPLTNPPPIADLQDESPRIKEFFAKHPEYADDVREIKRRIKTSDQLWRTNVLEYAITDWETINQQITTGTIEADDIASLAVDHLQSTSQDSVRNAVFANIKRLLQDNSGFSQTSVAIKFPSFFKLFLHFGRLEYIAEHVKDVTYKEQYQEDIADMDQGFTFSQTTYSQTFFSQTAQQTENWGFYDWFLPTTERDSVMRHFSNSIEQWAIKFSSEPTRFTLIRKTPGANQLEISHINFNPISPFECFSVDDGDRMFDNLPDLLRQTFNIDIERESHRITKQSVTEFNVVEKPTEEKNPYEIQ